MDKKENTEMYNYGEPNLDNTNSDERPQGKKQRTMGRLIMAVGKVMEEKGYTGVRASNIAQVAGVDKRLVWTYFGSVDNLVQAYLHQKDLWGSAMQRLLQQFNNKNAIDSSVLTNEFLQAQFTEVLEDKEFLKITHWELGENNKILRDLADRREQEGEKLFSIIMPDFAKTKVDVRARFALVMGGIYYLALHSQSNGGEFCGIDINIKSEKKRIENAIQECIFEMYEKAKTQISQQ